MGVPDDDGPVRKRPRLSLRTPHKPGQSKSVLETPDSCLTTEDMNGANQSPSSLTKTVDASSECVDMTGDFPSYPDPVVAPVASLHNLGNTCFLNCMLEVLRYTPDFLNGLDRLQEEIIKEERRMEKENLNQESSDPRLTWQVVKNTFALYKEMDKIEDHYKETATTDASSMATRPMVLLENIRELNPMFEGHFQHDAQELLRCLLCFIEDAENELIHIHNKRQQEAMFSVSEAGIVPNLTDEAEVLAGTGGTNDETGKVTLKGGQGRRASRKAIVRKIQKNNCGLNTNKTNKSSGTESVLGGGATDALLSETRFSKECNGECPKADISGSSLCSMRNERKPVNANHPPKPQPSSNSTSRNRKRKRSFPEPASCSDKTGADSGGMRTRRRRYSNKLDSARRCQQHNDDKVTISTGVHEKSPALSQSVSKQVEEQQSGCSTTANVFEKLRNKAQQLFSSKPSAAVSPECSSVAENGVDSSKSTTHSTFSLNGVRRLGMRGPIITDYFRKTFARTDAINQSSHDDDNNNTEHLNNNFDNCVSNNNNHNNSSNSEFRARVASTPDGKRQVLNSLDFPEGSRADLPQLKASSLKCSLTPPGNCEHQTTGSSPIKFVLKSPARSPIMIRHCDKISSIPDNEASSCESTIDSVTRKYLSSLPPTHTVAQTTQSYLLFSSSSDENRPGTSECVGMPSNSKSSFLLSEHILEPDKMISLTVYTSPRKRSEFPISAGESSEVATSSEKRSGLANNKLSTCLKNGSNVMTSMADRLLSGTKNDSLSKLSDEYSEDKKTLSKQTSDLMASGSKTVLSSGNFQAKKMSPASPYQPPSSTQLGSPGMSLLVRAPTGNEKVSSHVVDTLLSDVSPRPQIVLKKCDWLGVSPVKSVSAMEVLTVMDKQSQTPGHSRPVRRRILCDESLFPTGSSNDSEVHLPQENLPQCIDKNQKSEEKESSVLNINNYNNENESLSTPGPVLMMTSLTEPKNSQPDMTKSIHRPQRLLQSKIQWKECLGHSSDVAARKVLCPSVPNIPMRTLSVVLTNCDWLLAPGNGQPISARKALQDMKNAPGLGSESKVKFDEKIVSSDGSPERLELASLITETKEARGTLPDIKLQVKPNTLPEWLFGGIMMHRTKCLECEMARERQEAFMDVSIPVWSEHGGDMSSDDDRDEENNNQDSQDRKDKTGDSCLWKLMETVSNVERLKDSNKYYCEQCVHYVEAERSCHYLTLPAVLTLHLKRFSASSRLFGGVSKIVDKVTIPQDLPCLRYQCKGRCSDPGHRYSLFAIVTHSGTSILHGHYRAYVKVQHKVNPKVHSNLTKFKIKKETDEDLFSNKDSSPTLAVTTSGSQNGYYQIGDRNGVCQDRTDLPLGSETAKSFQSGGLLNSVSTITATMTSETRQNLIKVEPGFETHTEQTGEELEDKCRFDSKCENPGNFWLECDDECISVMDELEFMQKLDETDGSLIGTPYVLFYHKLLV